MRFRKSHIVRPETLQALKIAAVGKTMRQLAVSLKYPESYAATLGGVLAGKPGQVTPEGENVLRLRLGLETVAMTLATPCPSCGIVHGDGLDCHGKNVAAVAVLAPGERVAPAGAQVVKRRPPQRWRDMPVGAVRQALRERSVMT